MPIQYVILDFDGTCTEISAAEKRYLEEYIRIFAAEVTQDAAARWAEALGAVRTASPKAGWTLKTTAAAPAAADPYILANEAANYLVRALKITRPVPSDIHARANTVAQAQWRGEVVEVLTSLVARGLNVCFVSNSSTLTISHRLDDLLRAHPDVRAKIGVEGDALKFQMDELPFDADAIDAQRRAAFDALPAAATGPQGRPIYLRRGSYFRALCRVWKSNTNPYADTLVCGDIWELDLAMPAQLGCSVHLIKRQPPYETYGYEADATSALGSRGGMSDDLRGLLKRFA